MPLSLSACVGKTPRTCSFLPLGFGHRLEGEWPAFQDSVGDTEPDPLTPRRQDPTELADGRSQRGDYGVTSTDTKHTNPQLWSVEAESRNNL